MSSQNWYRAFFNLSSLGPCWSSRLDIWHFLTSWMDLLIHTKHNLLICNNPDQISFWKKTFRLLFHWGVHKCHLIHAINVKRVSSDFRISIIMISRSWYLYFHMVETATLFWDCRSRYFDFFGNIWKARHCWWRRQYDAHLCTFP